MGSMNIAEHVDSIAEMLELSNFKSAPKIDSLHSHVPLFLPTRADPANRDELGSTRRRGARAVRGPRASDPIATRHERVRTKGPVHAAPTGLFSVACANCFLFQSFAFQCFWYYFVWR
jgi:hypothetical protein